MGDDQDASSSTQPFHDRRQSANLRADLGTQPFGVVADLRLGAVPTCDALDRAIHALGELDVGLTTSAPPTEPAFPSTPFAREQLEDLLVTLPGPCSDVNLTKAALELDWNATSLRDDRSGLDGALEVARDDRGEGRRLESRRQTGRLRTALLVEAPAAL